MVTIAQKDILLELASGALALTKDFPLDDKEIEADRNNMGKLWNEIISMSYKDLDFNLYVKKIKSLRAKYEQ